MSPVKLLLLALTTIRFFISFHVVDGKCPANKLLEMFSTCRGREGVEEGSSWSVPLSWLKLTSSMVMLLDDTNSSGRPPDSELHDRLRRKRLVRLPRNGEMDPSRPREASETSVTALSGLLQAIPSHLQQSVPFCHEAARPSSCESLARNWRRETSSCFEQELVREAKVISSTRARANEGTCNLFLCVLLENWSVCMVFW